MATTDTSEKGLESLIEKSLLNEAGYVQGNPTEYDRTYCIDKIKLLQFLQTTQPDELAKLHLDAGGTAEQKFFQRLFNQIRAKGIVEVLRNGISHGEARLNLFYKQPASTLNPAASRLYNSNIFSITRQLRYSNDFKQLALDMAIFINGLPLITFELKNSLTKQTVKDAIRQYRQDRDFREPLFEFARCLVHFAVDDELVYMTTELKGKDTQFLPFNQGFNNGAGNPINPNGLKTAYLWKQILTKESLSNIIEKFAQVIEEESDKNKTKGKTQNKTSSKTNSKTSNKTKRKLIFPRYHQLEVVRRLLLDAKAQGVGHRYLIQHSAGSGKSNSITWLAHQLVELTDSRNTQPVFDSVIVVTDRTVLDKQIRDNIKQFAQVKGVVEAITEGSKQLRAALEAGKKIIITTVQKFPFVVEDIQSLSNKRFAVIIDEAHSSQGGSAAAKMSASLSKAGGEEEETTEDKILRIIEDQKLCPNASYFAFTATPKRKTLEAFGIRGTDGKFYPFHNYSMKQAIEEEFILDVLQNYATYATYCKLIPKNVDYDPQFDKKRAQKKLKRYVEGHPHAIRQKTEIMVDHFVDEVIRGKKINGQAKAMVVTNSILSAIRYKLAFDAYLQEQKLDHKAIVAFTGSKEDGGKDYTESKMNGFPSAEIPEKFKEDEYRFLIVADKFQTGFDEPLLHTMYVDKPLSDVKAVQTLSRLNRAYKPSKIDTFVLDFVNSVDAIREAFEPYYTTTILSEETDLNRLNDLQDALDAYQVYTPDQVEALMSYFISGADRERLDPILDECVQTYRDELDEDQKIDFKTKAKSFVRAYQFLAQILPFKNIYWESLKTFLKFLVAKLPNLAEEDLSQGILQAIDMDSYRVEREMSLAIQLSEATGELAPTPPEPRGRHAETELDTLSNILREFNDRFGNIPWQDADRVKRFLFEELPEAVTQDEEYQNAKQNSDRQNARITFEKKLMDKFQEFIFDQTEAYRQFTNDATFKAWLSDVLFNRDYDDGESAA